MLQEAEYAEVKTSGDSEEVPEQKPIKPEILLPQADRIPEIYDGNDSPLTATVTEDAEKNVINIDLKRDGSAN